MFHFDTSAAKGADKTSYWELDQHFPVEELFGEEDFPTSCTRYLPAAKGMLWDAFLLLLLCLKTHYSTLISLRWQSWASGIQIRLVMGGDASRGHRGSSQPKSAQSFQTEWHLQILLQKGNIGFAVVFFSHQSLSRSLWHSRLLCNNFRSINPVSRALFISRGLKMLVLAVTLVVPARCANGAGGIAGASSSVLMCHRLAAWPWTSYSGFSF